MGEYEIARAMIEDVRKALTIPGASPKEAAPTQTTVSLAEEGTTA
jgi:hypothetical protein